MKEIVFITPDDAAFGFSMIGLRQMVIEPAKTEGVLRQAMTDDTIGLIVLDERLLITLPEEILQDIERRWNGVLTILPGPQEGVLHDAYVSRLVSRAIGYQVKLN